MATDWSGECAPDKDRSARFGARETASSTSLLRTLVGAQTVQQLGPAAKIWTPSPRGGVVVDSVSNGSELLTRIGVEELTTL